MKESSAPGAGLGSRPEGAAGGDPTSAAKTVKTQVGCGGGTSVEGVAELALGGKRVLWQETNGGNNLELTVETATLQHPVEKDVSYVYDTGSGARVHSLRLRRTPRQLADLQGGLVVLVAGGAVHLVQVDTGKGVTIVPKGGGAVRAQLEPSGLFYSSADGLAFVPMATVLGRFRTT